MGHHTEQKILVMFKKSSLLKALSNLESNE